MLEQIQSTASWFRGVEETLILQNIRHSGKCGASVSMGEDLHVEVSTNIYEYE